MNWTIKAGFGIMVILIVFVLLIPRNSAPLLPLSPQVNATIFETNPTFRWSGIAQELLIDDNPSFTSPMRFYVAKTNSLVLEKPFSPGTYYWKLKGKQESGPWAFTIQGKAGLEVEKSDLGTLLKNTGNVDLSVVVEAAKSGITGALIVPAGKNRLLPQIFTKNVEAKEHES